MIRFDKWPGFLAALVILVGFTPSASAQTGSIAGTVVDAETGETLIGANVIIEGTSIGSTTDLDGRYTIKSLDPGLYDLVFSYIGYQSKRVRNVEVAAGRTTTIDLTLSPEAIGMGEVVVEARALQNTEAALLKQRQKAAAVSDAISAEAISRSGSSTAADAMEQVTGASVVGGKYVYVRGLGERYVSTQLNGATLPTADPDRNAVPLDLFPAGLLQNIVTTKSFTPDKPGSFTGGSVNLETNTYPDRTTLSFSTSTGFNTEVGWGDDLLLFEGGGLSTFGFDAADYGIPTAVLAAGSETVPRPSTQLTAGEVDLLDRASKAFSPVMAPTMRAVRPNASFDVSAGSQFSLFGRPLGTIAGFNYDRSVSGYDDGLSAFYFLTGSLDAATTLTPRYVLGTDVKGSQDVFFGGLVKVAYKPHDRHEIGFNYIRNHSDQASARYLLGDTFRQLINEGSDQWYETRTLRLMERDISSMQLDGTHSLPLDLRAEWNASLARTTQVEPDVRFFSNDFHITNGDTTYSISTNVYDEPNRYFRDLEETTKQAQLDLTARFDVGSRQWSLKVGGNYATTDRSFREDLFKVRVDNNARYSESGILRYTGNPAAYFQATGIRGTGQIGSRDFTVFGTYIDPFGLSGSYDGTRNISAAFGMLDGQITRRLRMIAGVRYEHTLQEIESVIRDTTNAIDEGTFLPSVNLVYSPAANVNVRAAYGRTLARPTLREMAPYTSFDFIGGVNESGNPGLNLTTVNNIDLRGEWFWRPGEIVAVSAFYKDFTDPIERAFVTVSSGSVPEVAYQNVPDATVYGLEVEVRKHLDQLANVLRHFQFGGNLTLARSSVAIPEQELLEIKKQAPNFDGNSRPLQGQSPYVVNLDLGYDNLDGGTTLSLHYNVFGKRMTDVVRGAAPEVFELSRHVLDLTASQRFGPGLGVKLKIHNLLNERVEFAQTFRGVDYLTQQYRLGRSVSLGVNYKF